MYCNFSTQDSPEFTVTTKNSRKLIYTNFILFFLFNSLNLENLFRFKYFRSLTTSHPILCLTQSTFCRLRFMASPLQFLCICVISLSKKNYSFVFWLFVYFIISAIKLKTLKVFLFVHSCIRTSDFLDAGDGWTFLYAFVTTYLVVGFCCYGNKFYSNLKSICFERKFMCVVCCIFIFTHFYHTDTVIIIIHRQHHQLKKQPATGNSSRSKTEVFFRFSLLMRWGFGVVQRTIFLLKNKHIKCVFVY